MKNKKHTIVVLTLFITMMSFTIEPGIKNESAASTTLANQVADALKREDAFAYVALFPSLDEFYGVMEKNAALYGDFLNEARNEFTSDYLDLLPSLRESFLQVIEEGKRRGIRWENIQLVKVETGSLTTDFTTVTVVLVFAEQNNTFKVKMNRALVLQGEWKVSPFLELL